MEDIIQILDRARAFEQEAHSILGTQETSQSRVVLLEQSYDKLAGLSLNQDELFREALRCIENGLFRASHVMAWAGFVDFLQEKLASDGFAKLRAARPNWKFKTVEELREGHPEYQIIEAGRATGLCSKNQTRVLHGLLSKRNECAHPSNYHPTLNEALGYISELLQRLDLFKRKAY